MGTAVASRERADTAGSINVTLDEPDRQGLIRSLLSQVRGITRQDAEDALQDAWIVLAEKANQLEPGPIGGYLLRTARFKALHIRDRRSRVTSLDALTDAAGDSLDVLADQASVGTDAHLELTSLADDPIAGRALAAAQRGASPRVAPRGMNHQCARYTDAQVAKVRALRAQGLTYPRIEQLTGVSAGYCPALVGRQSRVTPTTEGWTKEMAIDAIRRFHDRTGRAPRFRDADGNPTMPCPNTARRLFGTWRDAVRAAGLDPAYGDRRVRPWSEAEMVTALCLWRLRRKRWPNRTDMVNDPDLPSPATTRRHFGTQSPVRLAESVLARLA